MNKTNAVQKNCFVTIDFEDWQTIPYLAKYHFEKDQFPSFCEPSSLNPFFQELNIEGISATFFVVSSLAESHADLLRSLADKGNTIGCHSFNHDNLKEMSLPSFLASTALAKETIEKTIGRPIFCYRAPFFSADMEKITSLPNLGFCVDSSFINSTSNSYYAKNDFSCWKSNEEGFLTKPGIPLLELEMPTISFLGHRIPIGGGGFFRLYPFFLYKFFVHRYIKNHQNFVFFLHPYEINYKRFGGINRLNFKDRFRFEFGRKNAKKKFWKLIRYLKKEHFTFYGVNHYLTDAHREETNNEN